MKTIAGIVAALAVLLVTFAVSSPASAAPARERSENYFRIKEVKLADIGVCADVYSSGTYNYQTKSGNGQSRRNIYYTNIEVTNPRVTVYTYEMDRNGNCTSERKEVGKVQITQRHSGYGCDTDAAVGVSFPWGVSVEGWVDCGNKEQAKYSTTYGVDGSKFRQSNTGSPVRFGNESKPKRGNSNICYGQYVDLTMWDVSNRNSDSNNSSESQICIGPD